VISPEDDHPHPADQTANFNESMYLFLHGDDLTGFVRVANRPNEGRGERTVCLYRADGRVAFAFAPPQVTGNAALAGAGLRFRIVEPFVRLEVTFDGAVHLLEEPAPASGASSIRDSMSLT
jgi:hypothetical protein